MVEYPRPRKESRSNTSAAGTQREDKSLDRKNTGSSHSQDWMLAAATCLLSRGSRTVRYHACVSFPGLSPISQFLCFVVIGWVSVWDLFYVFRTVLELSKERSPATRLFASARHLQLFIEQTSWLARSYLKSLNGKRVGALSSALPAKITGTTDEKPNICTCPGATRAPATLLL